MGTLVCPLCCNEKFSSQLSLKYHLLSITDNMYCPDCSKRFDGILQLINHLDGTCGKSNINDTIERDEKIPPKEEENLKRTNLIDKQILEPAQEIHETKTNEPVKSPDVEHFVVEPELPMEVEIELDANSSNSQSKESDNSAQNNEVQNKDAMQIKNIPVNNEDFRNTKETTVNEEYEDMMRDNVPSVMTESQSVDMEVAPVMTEQYACSSCGVTFSSIVEHIQMYHTGQEVMINVPGTENEVLNKLVALPGGTDSSVTGEVEKTKTPANVRRSSESQRKSMLQQTAKCEIVTKHEIIRPFSLFREKTRIVANEEKIKNIVHQPKKIFKPVENSEIRCVSKEVKIGKFWEKEPDEKQGTPMSMEKILTGGIKKEVRKFQLKKDTRTSLEKLFSGNYLLKGSGGRGTRPGPYLGMNRVPEVKFIISPGDQGVENTISVYTCSTCQKEFGNISAFERHSCTVVKLSSLVCKICNVEFPNGKAMQSHMQDVHGIKCSKLTRPIRCGLCNVMFTSLRALKQHEKMHKPIEVKVPQESPENYVCSSNTSVNQQMQIHTNPLHIRKLEEHDEKSSIQTDKRDMPIIYVCKMCCKTFPNNEDLKAHWQEHGSQMEEDENIEKETLLQEKNDSLKKEEEAVENKKNTEPSTQYHREIGKSCKEARFKYRTWLPM